MESKFVIGDKVQTSGLHDLFDDYIEGTVEWISSHSNKIGVKLFNSDIIEYIDDYSLSLIQKREKDETLTYWEKLDLEIEESKFFSTKQILFEMTFDTTRNKWYKLNIQATKNITAELQVYLCSDDKTYDVRIAFLSETNRKIKCHYDKTLNLGRGVVSFDEAIEIGRESLKNLLVTKA